MAITQDNSISWTELTNQFEIPKDYLTTKSLKDVQLEYYVKRGSDGTLSIINTNLTKFTFKDATDTSKDDQSQLSIAMGSRGIETASDLASTSEQINAAKASQETQLIQQNLAKFNTELDGFKQSGEFPKMQTADFAQPVYDTFKSKYEQLRIAFSNFLEISDAHSLESTQKSLKTIQAVGNVSDLTDRHPVLSKTKLSPDIFVEQTAALTFYAAKYFVRLTICMLLNSFKKPTDVDQVVQKLPVDASIKLRILEIIRIFQTQIYPSDSEETTFSTKLINKVGDDYKWYVDQKIKLSIDKIIYLLLKDSVKRNSSNTNKGLLDSQVAYYVNQYCDRIIFILTYWVQRCSIDSTKSNIVYLHDVLMDSLVAQKQITNPVITFVKHRNTGGINHPRYDVNIDGQILEVHYSDDFSEESLKSKPQTFVKNVKLRHGPFTEIYDNTKTNSAIVESKAFQDNIYNKLIDGIPICIIGYGSSGSGKTSALIQLNVDGTTQDGVLILISEKLGIAGYTQCFVNIIELLNERTTSTNRFIQFNYENSEIKSNVADPTRKFGKQIWKQKGETNYDNTTHEFSAPIAVTTERDYGQTVGDYIMHFMKTRRRTFKTPNNPESSRSHVIIVIKYKNIAGDVLTLIICDFAGVENKFDCNSETVDNDFISQELMHVNPGRKLNQTELFQRQSIVKHEAKSVIDVGNLNAKLVSIDLESAPYKNINMALTTATNNSKFGSNEKIKIAPEYETIKTTFGDIDKLLIFINQLFFATTAQVPSTSLPVTITQYDAVIGDELKFITPTTGVKYVKRSPKTGIKTLSGFKKITQEMFGLQSFQNPLTFYATFAINNMVNISYPAEGHVMKKNSASATRLSKYGDPHTGTWITPQLIWTLPNEYVNSKDLTFRHTYSPILSGKLTIDEINTAISTIFPNFSDFLNLFKKPLTTLATAMYVNKSNPSDKLDLNVIIPFAFWLRTHFLNDYNVDGMQGLFEQIIYKYDNSSITVQSGGLKKTGEGLCEDRLIEGYYINSSLLDLRVAIKQLLSSKFGYGIPVFDGYCRANYQCSVEDADCMGSEEYPPIIHEPTPAFNAGQLLETIYEYCGSDESKDKLIFCIFCAFNTSTNIKADVIPYIDISELQRLYQKLKGNMYTRSIIDLNEIMERIKEELLRIVDPNNHAFYNLPSRPVRDEISNNVELVNESKQLNPETILRATKRIIDQLIQSNDSTPPGTLDFTSEQGAKRFLGANTCSVAQLTASGGGSANSQLIPISGTRKGRTYSNSLNKYSKLRTKKIRK